MKYRKNMNMISRLTSVTLLLTLLIVPEVIHLNQAAGAQPSQQGYSDFGLSLLSAGDRITLDNLQKLTHGDLSTDSFATVIQGAFLPLGIRRVLLDVGWQNFTVGNIPYEAWVANWLLASEEFGVQNIIYAGQFTLGGVGSPWAESMISIDPATQSYYANGTAAPYVQLDDPDVALQVAHDLQTLNSYYGQFTSWVGIGTGSTMQDPYYTSDSTSPKLGYSNLTLAAFANSLFFSRDVNATGYNTEGELDKIWAAFKAVPQQVELDSGNWMTSTPTDLVRSTSLAMRFHLPRNSSALQLMWYGSVVGAPGDLELRVFPDTGGPPGGNAIIDVQAPEGIFSTTAGWQGPMNLTGFLAAGYYWAVFSDQSANATNHYSLFTRDYYTDDSLALTSTTSTTSWSNIGTSILWLRESNETLRVYPFEQPVVIPSATQNFTLKQNLTFNTVFLFLSDRHYDPINATLVVKDTSKGGGAVATGVLSQALTQGLQNWIPVTLNTTVAGVAGHTYSMELVEPENGITWHVAQRGLYTSPAEAGFQGQSSYWLFRVALVNWGAAHLDYTGMTSNGADAVTRGKEDALRFQVAQNSTLDSVSLLTENPQTGAGNYSSGQLTVELRESNAAGDAPTGNILERVSVSGAEIPFNGWFNASGFSSTLQSGKYYWLVFSTESSTAFPFARLVNPYSAMVKSSSDNGSTWAYPVEGPTEFSYVLHLDGDARTIGNFVESIPIVPLIASEDSFAQSFSVPNETVAAGIYLGPVRAASKTNGSLLVSIHPDNGRGKPSANAMGTGLLNSTQITLPYGLQFVQFSSFIQLRPYEQYWLVVQPEKGSFAISPVVYLNSSGKSLPVTNTLISNDSGFSWSRFSNETAILSYRIAEPVAPPSQFSLASLAQEVVSYHDYSTASGLLHGWNAYLQSAELRTYEDALGWFHNATGRNLQFFADVPQNLLNQGSSRGIVQISSAESVTDCEGVQKEVAAEGFSARGQFLEVSNLPLMQGCLPALAASVSRLAETKFPGANFGDGTSNDVLILGGTPVVDANFSSSFRSTYIDVGSDPGLQSIRNLSVFGSVIWSSSAGEPSLPIAERLQSYAREGGNLIIEDTSSSVFGLNLGASGQGNSSVGQVLLIDELTAHTSFKQSLKVVQVSNSAIIASSSELTVASISIGRGMASIINSTGPTIPQVSDYFVVVQNAVALGAGAGGSPIWYGGGAKPTGVPSVGYRVMGEKGSTLLIWLSNPSNVMASTSISLNGTYFGVSNEWRMLNLSAMSSTTERGNLVSLNATVPPRSWVVYCVIPSYTNLAVQYSNIVLVRGVAYPNQGLYSLLGVSNQSTLTLVTSDTPVSAVLLNDKYAIPERPDAASLVSNGTGWVYNQSEGTLLIGYQSSGYDSVRVALAQPPLKVPPAIPINRIALVALGLVCLELVVFAAYSIDRRRKG